MKTTKELYAYLQSLNKDEFLQWLEEPWVGKDKQESALRLFAPLGCIQKLSDYHVCSGNFNLKTISKMKTFSQIFYDTRNNLVQLKDKGDSSDLTCISKTNDKHLLVTTSKNNSKKTHVGKLDIDKILTNFQQYRKDDFTMSLCVCIRNVDDFNTMKENIEITNAELKNKSLLENENFMNYFYYI